MFVPVDSDEPFNIGDYVKMSSHLKEYPMYTSEWYLVVKHHEHDMWIFKREDGMIEFLSETCFVKISKIEMRKRKINNWLDNE